MMRFRPRWNLSSLLGSKAVFLLAIALLVLLSTSLGREILRRRDIRDEVRRLETEIAALENDTVELTGLITYLKSDEYRERAVRSQLGRARPGERAVYLPEDSRAPGEVQGAEDSAAAVTPPQRKWWQYFFPDS